MWPLLNLVFLQSDLQEICCFLECHPTRQFRISFLPVLDVIYCALCTQNEGKPLCKTTLQYTVIHTPQSHCFMNTDYQRSQKFYIYVKCEQHSTKIHKFNSGSMVIT